MLSVTGGEKIDPAGRREAYETMIARVVAKTIFRLRRHYLALGLSGLRAAYWRGLGMEVGRGCKISSLVVTWPHRVSLGARCSLEHDVYLNAAGPYADGVAIAFGAGCFVGSGCEFNISSGIEIGEACLIGSGSRFIDHNHGMGAGIMKEQEETQGRITVEPDVWIGANCVVLQGVTIGRGAVIGAGSVVTKDVAPFTIVVGVAARAIGHRADLVSKGARLGLRRVGALAGVEAESGA